MAKSDRPDSAIARWVADGGTLKTSNKKRHKLPALFPHMGTGKAERIDPFAMLMVVGLVLAFGFWLRIMHKTFTGLADPAAASSYTYTREAKLAFTFTPLPTIPIGSAAVRVVDLNNPPQAPTMMIVIPPTVELSPTSTATFTVTPSPTITPSPTSTSVCDRCSSVQEMAVRIGWFYPPLGGYHCANGGECVDQPLSDRAAWLPRVGAVAACPAVLDGAIVEVVGIGVYPCVHVLPALACDWVVGYCDISILSNGAIAAAPDWRATHAAKVYFK